MSSFRSILRLVADRVSGAGAAEAVLDPVGGRTLTYAQLWESSGRLAGRLRSLGVGRGDRVAVGQDRSADMVVSFLGTLRAGAAYVPLDREAPPSRMEGILEETGARALVCSDPERSGAAPWHRLRTRVPRISAWAEDAAEPVPEEEIRPEDTAYICYTSGSTGRPKGVCVPHRAVHRLVHAPVFCRIGSGDRVSSQANPAFDVTTFEIWNSLTAGATAVVLPSLPHVGLEEWASLVTGLDLDVLSLPTAVFHTVARERPEIFASARSVVVAGEQMDITAAWRVLEAAPTCGLINAYGPTEATTFASYFECTKENLAGRDRVPIGFPLQGTSLHLLDDELAPTPAGRTGELCIGGPGLADGYLGLPELTADRFVHTPEGRLYRTGDMGRLLADGAIELQGRRDRQVKLRGFRIELEEIERRAVATKAVDSAFVEKLGEGESAALVGFALPARGTDIGAGDLNRLLSESLPAYMLPSRWILLDEVPVNSTGKADRGRLLALLDAPSPVPDPGAQRNPSSAEADPETLEEVRRIWCEVLDLSDVRPSDNFIELGGESVLAGQVASLLRERVDPEAEAAMVLLSDSLADLAVQLRPGRGNAR